MENNISPEFKKALSEERSKQEKRGFRIVCLSIGEVDFKRFLFHSNKYTYINNKGYNQYERVGQYLKASLRYSSKMDEKKLNDKILKSELEIETIKNNIRSYRKELKIIKNLDNMENEK